LDEIKYNDEFSHTILHNYVSIAIDYL